MSTPSSKVTVQFFVGLGLAVALYATQNTEWIGALPSWAVAPVSLLVAAVAAYLKAETNPAPSTYTFHKKDQ
jgi:cell shape-determining protein MreC